MSGSNALTITRDPTVLVNPLAAMDAGVKSAGSLMDVQSKQGEQLVGQALQQATDEQGNVDIGKAQRIASQMGPNAAFAMQGFLRTGAALRGSQIEQGGAMYNNIARAGISVATDPSDENVEAQRAAMLRQFPGQAQQINAEFDAVKAMQPAERVAAARNHAIGALDASDRMHQTFGTTFKQTGPTGATIGGWQAPAWQGGGVAAPAGQPGAPQGLDPSQAAERQRWLQSPRDYPDPANPTVTKHGTNETFLRDTGVPDKYIYTGGAPASPGTQPPATSPLGTGRPPPVLLNPNKPQATPAATSSPAGTGISGPTPEQKATAGATEEQGKLSPPKFQDIVAQGVAARSQDALLATMLSEAQGFRPGPGADLAATVKRTILGLGAQFGATFGVDTDKLAKQESVAKIANQLADAQGAGSDARLRVSEGANPSLHNTPAGLDLIIRQLRGNTDYLRARQQLAAAYPNKADIEGFESKIGANLDPRVFQYERLQPSQRRDYFKGMTDKQAFIKAHDWAAQQKLIGGGGG